MNLGNMVAACLNEGLEFVGPVPLKVLFVYTLQIYGLLQQSDIDVLVQVIETKLLGPAVILLGVQHLVNLLYVYWVLVYFLLLGFLLVEEVFEVLVHGQL
jgi:hypothetical protein